MVALDEIKSILNTYEAPLEELRDSLSTGREEASNRRIRKKDWGSRFLGRCRAFAESDEGAEKSPGLCKANREIYPSV